MYICTYRLVCILTPSIFHASYLNFRGALHKDAAGENSLSSGGPPSVAGGSQSTVSDKPGAKRQTSKKKRDKFISFHRSRATNSIIPAQQQKVSGKGVRFTHMHKTNLVTPNVENKV